MDADNVPTNLDAIYEKVAVDVPLAQGTASDKAQRSRDIDHQNQHNERQKAIFSCLRKHFTSKLHTDLLTEYQEITAENELLIYHYWRTLLARYGEQSNSAVVTAIKRVKCLVEKMPDTADFTTWIITKKLAWVQCKVDKETCHGYLLSLSTDESGFQMLPDRFVPAINHARLTNMTYEQTETYYIQQEQTMQQSIQLKNSKKKDTKKPEKVEDVKAVQAKSNKSKKTNKSQQGNQKNNSNNKSNNSDKPNVNTRSNSKKQNSNTHQHNSESYEVGKCECGNNYRKWEEFYDKCKLCFDATRELNSKNFIQNKTNNSNKRSNNYQYNGHNKKAKNDSTVMNIKIQKGKDDYDSDDDYGSDVDIQHLNVNHVNSNKFNNPKSSSSDFVFPMLLDSGAQANCVSAKYLSMLHNVRTYNADKVCGKTLLGANGKPMTVLAKGYYRNFPEKLYVVKELKSNLLSTSNWFFCQCEKGTSILVNDTMVSGALIKNNEVKLLANTKLEVDLDKFEDDMYMNIHAGDLTEEMRSVKTTSHINSVQKVYGLESQSEADRMAFISETLLYSKKQMIQACTLIKNIPINESNIKRYFVDLAAKKGGQSKMRHKNFRKPKSYAPIIIEDEDDYDFDFSKDDKSNLIVGEKVGSDQLGHYKGKSGMLFVDKASGFVVCYFNKATSEKKSIHQTTVNVKKISSYYKTYNHQINILVSDAHSLYTSNSVQETCILEGIKQEISPPGIHQLNGLAEVTIQHLNNLVTTMYILAPYTPQLHWPFYLQHAIDTVNLKASRVPGNNEISRYEEFYHEQPDFNLLGLAPAGILVKYTIPKEQRTIKFTDKTALGLYYGRDRLSPGGILIYNPDTKKLIRSASYRYLTRQQIPYNWHKRDPLSIIHTPTDQIEVDEENSSEVMLSEGGKPVEHRIVVSKPITQIVEPTVPVQTFNNVIPTVPVATIPTVPLVTPTVPPAITANLPTVPVTIPTVPVVTENATIPVVPTNIRRNVPVTPTVPIRRAPNTPHRMTTRKISGHGHKQGPVRLRVVINPNRKKVKSAYEKMVFKVKKKNRSYDNPTSNQAIVGDDKEK